MNAVRIRGVLTCWSGFGQTAERVGRGLEALGSAVTFEDYGADRRFLPECPYMHDRVSAAPAAGWVVHLAPPHYPFDRGNPTLFFTMFETTRVSDLALAYLNAADVVAVPCRWNADCLRDQGVARPVVVVPLGVDPAEGFTPAPVEPDGPTVFGLAGRVGGNFRKGFDEGMWAFVAAFPDPSEAVRLRVKVWPDCLERLTIPPDPRIEVSSQPMLPAQMALWTQSITCLLVPSKAEGWGLHTLQAMACGRPVIAAKYGGTAEFFDGSCGWELEYDVARAYGPFYSDGGDWCEPRHESMVAALRAAHAARSACRRKGAAAASRAAEFPWDRTARALAAAMSGPDQPSEVN